MTTSATSRGTTSMRIGESPSDCSASICSVTTIEPSSAEIAAPERPATTTAESIGPSSRAIVNATRAADEVADAVLHGLIGGFERKDHAGAERGQEHDAPRLHAQEVGLLDGLAHANAQPADEPCAVGQQHRGTARVREEPGRLAPELFEHTHDGREFRERCKDALHRFDAVCERRHVRRRGCTGADRARRARGRRRQAGPARRARSPRSSAHRREIRGALGRRRFAGAQRTLRTCAARAASRDR